MPLEVCGFSRHELLEATDLQKTRVCATRFESSEKAQVAGREQRFRIRVVTAYNYTRALTPYRPTTITNGTIADAGRT